jgi:hypothetical protein
LIPSHTNQSGKTKSTDHPTENKQYGGGIPHKTGDKDFLVSTSVNTLKELTLNYTQNILTIEFSAMDFTALKEMSILISW